MLCNGTNNMWNVDDYDSDDEQEPDTSDEELEYAEHDTCMYGDEQSMGWEVMESL